MTECISINFAGAVYLDFREEGPDVYTPRRGSRVFKRFNRIISHLFPFPVLFIPLASPRRPTHDDDARNIHHRRSASRLRASRSRPTISSCCFLCQKSTPLRLLHSVNFFFILPRPSYIPSTRFSPPNLLPVCLPRRRRRRRRHHSGSRSFR